MCNVLFSSVFQILDLVFRINTQKNMSSSSTTTTSTTLFNTTTASNVTNNVSNGNSASPDCLSSEFALYGGFLGVFTTIFVLLCAYFGYHLIYKSPIAHRDKK